MSGMLTDTCIKGQSYVILSGNACYLESTTVHGVSGKEWHCCIDSVHAVRSLHEAALLCSSFAAVGLSIVQHPLQTS